MFDLERYAELIALRALAMQSVACLVSLAPDPQTFVATFEREVVTALECLDFEMQGAGATVNTIKAEEQVRRLVIAAVEGWFSTFRGAEA